MNRLSYISTALLATCLLVGPSSAQDVHPGQELFVPYCAPCHGASLQGGAGPSLVDDEWLHGNERGQIFATIAAGVPGRAMPAFGGVLTEEQINHVVDFIEMSAAEAESVAGQLPEEIETLDYRFAPEVFVDGLEIPWAIAFVDERTALITERPGRLRVVEDGKMRAEPVAGIPVVVHEGQGGLLDVAVDPEYEDNGWIYLAYSHGLDTGADRPPAMTRIVRGRIQNNRWIDQEVVFEAPHDLYLTTRHHYGSRIVFEPDGHLLFSIGDRGRQDMAQDLGRPNGKIHRVHRDGSIPDDNPFVGRSDALPSIYSYGHRNPQGLSIHPETGALWAVEHGPRGGDELNLVRAGKNYGWPVITYGINYDGTIITEERHREGMEQPVTYWRPSIAVSGASFYDGGLFLYWRNRLIVSALRDEEVRVLDLDGDRVLHQEVVAKGLGRIREAVAGPDGAIYLVLNDPDRIVRLGIVE